MIIRRLASIHEYAACEQLMQDCWQTTPLEAVPAHLLITIQGESGMVLGAFTPEERLVGFVMGFLSRDGDRLKHHSHMAGVHPDFRDQSIAYRLKLAQREEVLRQNLGIITWTYDPLEARNATLNIAKLGAVAYTYKRNIYGQLLGSLNANLPTDRFMVHWPITSERVQHCVSSGQRVRAPIAGSAAILSRCTIRNDLPILNEIAPIPNEALLIGVQIPKRMQHLKRDLPDQALEWRMQTRTFFEAAFSAGFQVVNVSNDAEHPYDLAVYTLTR